MNAPITALPKCDVFGCGHLAVKSTTGSETDAQGLGRPALAKLNVCANHHNWPHSEDAQVFATTAAYRERK
jgi:hypothetical protein